MTPRSWARRQAAAPRWCTAHRTPHPAPLALPVAPLALTLTALMPAAHASVDIRHSTNLEPSTGWWQPAP
ncbi:hypothetical protein [Streptomyces sp. NPDC096013]|uniref:hypothetical protein n=1 Tax=Streptomyces sp. NPDC096013 TaxID=3366069 RepID=UPI00380DF0EB